MIIGKMYYVIFLIQISILQHLATAAIYEAMGSHNIAADFLIELADVNATSLTGGYEVR